MSLTGNTYYSNQNLENSNPITDDIQTNTDNIAMNTTNIAINTADISSLNATVAGHTSQISAITTVNNTQTTSINNLNTITSGITYYSPDDSTRVNNRVVITKVIGSASPPQISIVNDSADPNNKIETSIFSGVEAGSWSAMNREGDSLFLVQKPATGIDSYTGGFTITSHASVKRGLRVDLSGSGNSELWCGSFTQNCNSIVTGNSTINGSIINTALTATTAQVTTNTSNISTINTKLTDLSYDSGTDTTTILNNLTITKANNAGGSTPQFKIINNSVHTGNNKEIIVFAGANSGGYSSLIKTGDSVFMGRTFNTGNTSTPFTFVGHNNNNNGLRIDTGGGTSTLNCGQFNANCNTEIVGYLKVNSTNVETLLSTHTSQISALKSSDTSQNTTLSLHTSQITALDTRLTTNEALEVVQNGRLTAVETVNATQTTNISTNTNDITDLQTAIKNTASGSMSEVFSSYTTANTWYPCWFNLIGSTNICTVSEGAINITKKGTYRLNLSWHHKKATSGGSGANSITDFYAQILTSDVASNYKLALIDTISIKMCGQSNSGSSFNTLSEDNYFRMPTDIIYNDWRMKYKVRYDGSENSQGNIWFMEIIFLHTANSLKTYKFQAQGTYGWALDYGKFLLEYVCD